MKIRTILLSFLTSYFISLTAQTNVPLSLVSNAHWTLAGSPYIVSGSTVLFNTDTLIIDPGVTVKFNSGASLEIRGFLYAFGTPGDTIEFTSNDASPHLGSWAGIKVTTPTGSITQLHQVALSYCKASYANYFMDLGNTINGPYTFNHCFFAYNGVVASGCDGGVWPVKFDSCSFYGNTIGAGGGNTWVNNCLFNNNVTGVSSTNHVYNSYFSGNTGVAAASYGATVGCTFVNNAIAFKNNFNAGNDTFMNNYVVDNDTGVIITQQYFSSSEKFTGNTICNHFYNIMLLASNPADLSHNCWCNADSATIRSKIYDGYINNTYGLVSFSPIGAACPPALGENEIINNDLPSIAPNPFSDKLSIRNGNGKPLHLAIYDLNGKVLIDESIVESKEVSVSLFVAGIYMYQMTSEFGIKQGKIVKY